ncbi:MAG: hypothetical protein IKV35_01335, partial [Clostridia bacterium]|nr:hypothetical protein [Clostridia bacterium]
MMIILAAVALLWYGNVTSCQAETAMMAQVYFDGNYRIADGAWQKIEEGRHISSTQGDVTLRGNFHLLTPDGEYVGVYDGDVPIALYVDHINLTICEGNAEPFVMDYENPLFGDSACGVDWAAYSLMSGTADPIEIRVHNPHRFGNVNAIDDMLANTALWADVEFEKGVLDSDKTQRNIGSFLVMASLLFLGSALFSSLIHIKNGKLLWILGAVILLAGVYLIYSADGISFRSESIVSNTTILGCSMMLYMLFLSMVVVHFFKHTRKVGAAALAVLGAVDAVLFMLPIFTDVLFYDTWFYWVGVQILANIVLLGCLIKEFIATSGKERWLYLGAVLPLVSFGVDVVMTGVGAWEGGLVSAYVFIVFFVTATVVILRIIPHSINALSKAKTLETEKI